MEGPLIELATQMDDLRVSESDNSENLYQDLDLSDSSDPIAEE